MKSQKNLSSFQSTQSSNIPFHNELFHHVQYLFKNVRTLNINCNANLQKFVTMF